MRRIAANFVFPVTAPPVRNGILELEEDGRIARVVDPGSQMREMRRMEFHNGILVPGFVNCHNHLELSFLKGKIPKATGLHGFLKRVQKERLNQDESSVIQPMREADQQMRREGIRICADVSNTGSSFPVKAESPLHYHTLIEVFGFTSRQIEQGHQEGRRLFEKLTNEYNLPGNLVAHAGYSADSRLIRQIASAMKKQKNIFSIHYRESSRWKEQWIRLVSRLWYLAGEGRMEMRHWQGLSLPNLAQALKEYTGELSLLLVHNRFAGKKDIDDARRFFSHPVWVFCPRSNLHIHNSLPDLPLFVQEGQAIALGTDSLASNDTLSMLEELKVLQKHFPGISFERMLGWATCQGARALGLEQTFGSFGPGMHPGINLIKPFDFKHMRLLPESRVYPIS
jgi:cytosine/adenosine deaminase-related metal-dependent hydrolase